MNTKLAVVLLSGISVFMSVGAFAVSEEKPADYINWSYASADMDPVVPAPVVKAEPVVAEPTVDPRKCTAGCPSRDCEEVKPLTLTYEDEATPIIERTESFADSDRFVQPLPNPTPAVSISATGITAPMTYGNQLPPPMTYGNQLPPPVPQIDTHYVQTEPQVQYPITRQYPISVQYPVTVQRNVTVEQPVLMQQPVIVRRPVVMQQDVTVQRQPTVVYQKPVIMQQQPTYIQQKPIVMQAPASPVNPDVWNNMPQSTLAPVPYPQPVMPTAPMMQPVMPQQPQLLQQQRVQSTVPAIMPTLSAPGYQSVQQPTMPVVQPTYPLQ